MEILKLKDIILNCLQYEETDDLVHQIFAKRIDGQFEASSEAIVLKLNEEEAEMKIKDISEAKCPGFDYFLELFILQEFIQGLNNSNKFKFDKDKIARVIQYAEFDA